MSWNKKYLRNSYIKGESRNEIICHICIKLIVDVARNEHLRKSVRSVENEQVVKVHLFLTTELSISCFWLSVATHLYKSLDVPGVDFKSKNN